MNLSNCPISKIHHERRRSFPERYANMTEKQKILNCLKHQPYEGETPVMFFTMNPGMFGIKNIELPVCERGMGSTGYDVFGVHWTAAAQASHYTLDQKPRYSDIESWREELKIPNIEKLDWSTFIRESEEIDREKYVVTLTSYMGPFERATCLTSFEDCLVDLISEPEEFADLIGAIADYKIALLTKAIAIAKPDVVNIHDDWGTANSTFMNPDLWREVIKPHIKRIYDCVIDGGAIVVQHSCGKVGALVGDMVEMGASAWEAQSDCNDIPALTAQYGDKLCILGGLGGEEGEAFGGPPAEISGDAPKAELPPLPPEQYPAYPEFPAYLFD